MEILRPAESSLSVTGVSVMRQGDAFGSNTDDLLDGNTLPSLCRAVAEGACKGACQLQAIPEEDYMPAACAEENIDAIVQEFGIGLDRLAIVPATEDTVVFADSLNELAELPEHGNYQVTPAGNAFFFRPGLDKTLNDEPLCAAGMRMADCGAVSIEGEDANGDLVLGISHFTKSNLRGPGAYKETHQINGVQVTWAEYVLYEMISHYAMKPESLSINLIAAIGDKEYEQKYTGMDDARKHFPGWDELGFLHPNETTARLQVNYRDMVVWQLRKAAERFAIDVERLHTDQPINTGDVSLGHASHRQHRNGVIASGRDLYLVGVDIAGVEQRLSTIDDELTKHYNTLEYYAGSADTDGVEADIRWADSKITSLTSERENLERLKKILND